MQGDALSGRGALRRLSRRSPIFEFPGAPGCGAPPRAPLAERSALPQALAARRAIRTRPQPRRRAPLLGRTGRRANLYRQLAAPAGGRAKPARPALAPRQSTARSRRPASAGAVACDPSSLQAALGLTRGRGPRVRPASMPRRQRPAVEAGVRFPVATCRRDRPSPPDRLRRRPPSGGPALTRARITGSVVKMIVGSAGFGDRSSDL